MILNPNANINCCIHCTLEELGKVNNTAPQHIFTWQIIKQHSIEADKKELIMWK